MANIAYIPSPESWELPPPQDTLKRSTGSGGVAVSGHQFASSS